MTATAATTTTTTYTSNNTITTIISTTNTTTVTATATSITATSASSSALARHLPFLQPCPHGADANTFPSAVGNGTLWAPPRAASLMSLTIWCVATTGVTAFVGGTACATLRRLPAAPPIIGRRRY